MTEPARLRGERTAATVLLAGGPVLAFAVLAICVLAVPLAPAGLWRPAVVTPLLVVVLIGLWWPARWIPVRGGPAVPVWSAAAVVALAVGFGVWAAVTHGEHVVLRRDAGSYALYAQWLATRHGLPVDAHLAAFGGPSVLDVPGFTLASPAYYQVVGGSAGATVVPQFLIGAPALYSLGWWLAGWPGLFVAPAVLGAAAVLAAGGLAARVVGPRWAPAAAAGLALTQPVLHSARSTYSEPPAMLLVLAAGCLAVDALTRRPTPVAARRLAVLAGVLCGLAGLVRIDALREVALLVPVCVLLAMRRHPGALIAPAAIGSVALAMIPAVWLSRPYLSTVSASLRPLVVATAGLTVAGVVVVLGHRLLVRRSAAPPGRTARLAERWLPPLTAAGVLLIAGVLASRPLWTVSHQAADDPAVPLIADLQRQQGLPVDGARTYAEQSVTWVVWYCGIVAVIAAAIGLAGACALVVRWWLRTGRDRATPPPAWAVPVVVGLGSVVLTLYRPGITPDHPWADRRLVPVVLPVVMIAATGVAAWGVRYARRRMPIPLLVAVVATAVVALLVPAADATRPVALDRTEVGEPKAVAAVCSALRPGDVVVSVSDATGGDRAQNEWVQVVRGVCDHPSAAVRLPRRAPASREIVDRLGRSVAGAGGHLVLLVAGEQDDAERTALDDLGLTPRLAVRRRTFEDQHLLTRRPDGTVGLTIEVWLADWTPSAGSV